MGRFLMVVGFLLALYGMVVIMWVRSLGAQFSEAGAVIFAHAMTFVFPGLALVGFGWFLNSRKKKKK